MADVGLAMYGLAEWEYSFHWIKGGAVDGAGVRHYGGYPTPPATRAEAAAVIERYYRRLADDARKRAKPHERGLFYSINGHYCYQHYGCLWGCDVVGSEVGENVNGVQAHIAFTRGAARQFGKPWLIDFSSWFGPAIFDEDPKRHWGDNSGPDHGHSLSLHRRTYEVAYMAGANAVVAEGGWLNCLKSQTPEADGFLPLSRLGEQAREFYQFTQAEPERGLPYVPIAVVIDTEHGIYPGFGPKLAWNAFRYTPADERIVQLWQEFFPGSLNVQANQSELGYLVASPHGDIVDILLTNATPDTLAYYPVVILAGEVGSDAPLFDRLKHYVETGGTLVLPDLTVTASDLARAWLELDTPLGSEPGTARRQKGQGSVIVYHEGADPGPLRTVLDRLRGELVPLRVTGKVETLFNRLERGWIVTLVNNEGITKTFREPPKMTQGPTNVTLQYLARDEVEFSVLGPISTKLETRTRQATVSIPPGAAVFVRLAPKE
jgi:hypothetical protein